MIKYLAREPEVGQGYMEISNGFLRAQVENKVVAKLLLQMPQGEYISREIVSRVVLYKMANPEISQSLDFDTIFYTLGEAQDDEDFGTYRVPCKIFVQIKR